MATKKKAAQEETPVAERQAPTPLEIARRLGISEQEVIDAQGGQS